VVGMLPMKGAGGAQAGRTQQGPWNSWPVFTGWVRPANVINVLVSAEWLVGLAAVVAVDSGWRVPGPFSGTGDFFLLAKPTEVEGGRGQRGQGVCWSG